MHHYENLLAFLTTLFNLNGINPLRKSLLQNFIVTLELTSILVTVVLVYFNLQYNEMTMKLFIDSVESIFSCSQMFFKLLCFVTKKAEIEKLLQDVAHFWNLDQFDPKFRNGCIKQVNNIHSIIKTFVILCASVMFFFMLCPFLIGRLAIICYIPESVPKPIFYIFNSLTFGYNGMGVVAFDSFVCTTIFLLQLQHKLLNKKIKMLKFEKVDCKIEERVCLREMAEVIEYQQFLSRFLVRFNSIIGFTSLVQFILYIVSMCFEMYYFSRGSDNVVEALKSLMYMVTLSFEMVICFCIPSTFIMEETSKTLQVIYESKWYETTSAPIKRNILIMMVKNQQAAAIWAGNMFIINLETCTEAFKKTLSFYACLKTIGENN